MIDLNGMISIPFLKKTVFTGSCHEMNFMIKKVSEDDTDKTRAIAWPGPFCFEKTEDEKKVFSDFPFTHDGILEAVAWLNRHYEENYGKSEKSV
ncbi:MAG: hypothetical protein MR528_01335 [Lachnospiraceae bacterium]|nr:hypothetical protein [Lachnospiraceae bacterium]